MRIRFVKKKRLTFFCQVRSDGFLTFSNLSNMLFENPSLFPLPLILGFSDRCHSTSMHLIISEIVDQRLTPHQGRAIVLISRMIEPCNELPQDKDLLETLQSRISQKKTIIVSMYCSLIAHMFNTLHPQKESSLLLVRMEMFSSPQKHWEDDIGPSTTMGYPRLSF